MQRGHELLPQLFVERMGGDQRLQLGDEPSMAAVGELGVDAVFDGNEPEQLEARRFILQEAARLRGREGVTAPEAQGSPQHGHRVDPIIGLLCLRDEIGESVDIDGVTGQRHAVAGCNELDQ